MIDDPAAGAPASDPDAASPAAAPVADSPATASPDGGSAGASPAAPSATGAVADPAQPNAEPATSAAALQAAIDEIEGRHKGQPFKIPADVELPWKRKGEQGFASVRELIDGGMMERDYHSKMREVAENRRAMEEENVRIQARGKYLESEFQRFLKAASTGGEEWDRYQRHLEMLQTDDVYRENVEKAALRREDEAVEQHSSVVERQEYITTARDNALAYINKASKEKGVDPRRIEQLYTQAVQRGAPLHADAVDAIIADELKYHGEITRPLQDSIAKLEQQLKDLQAEISTAKHNRTTEARIERAGVKAGQPVNGSPPGPTRPAPFNPATEALEDAKRRGGWTTGSQRQA